jgi:predicted O-methyltransferase YrrM
MQLIWRPVTVPLGEGPLIDTSLTEAETAELQRLAKDAEVLEIGTAYGYSTVALALVAKRVFAVDPHLTHGSYGDVLANLTAYGVSDRAVVMKTYSQHAMPAFYYEGRRFDMVWIDGDHTPEGVEHDVTWALKLLKPGGVLACHDYDEVTCPGVRVALDKLFGGPGELTDTLAVYHP